MGKSSPRARHLPLRHRRARRSRDAVQPGDVQARDRQPLLSSEARIDSSRLRTGRLEDTDWRKLGDALGKLSEAPLFIDDTPSISLMEIRAKCRRLKQKHGLDLVIVDYLQLMQSHRRVDSRQQEVAEISRGLKMLAKELDVPVIALSQLSRQPESRTDKRPSSPTSARADRSSRTPTSSGSSTATRCTTRTAPTRASRS
jgi:hypothetical protein